MRGRYLQRLLRQTGRVWEKPESKLPLCLLYLPEGNSPIVGQGNLDLNDKM